jgi:hypothetical protein
MDKLHKLVKDLQNCASIFFDGDNSHDYGLGYASGLLDAAERLERVISDNAEKPPKSKRRKWRNYTPEDTPCNERRVEIKRTGHYDNPGCSFVVEKELWRYIDGEAKSKRPSLAKLVKRLNKHQVIELWHDGTATLNTYEPELDAHKTENFDTIAALKEYLLTLPERDA